MSNTDDDSSISEPKDSEEDENLDFDSDDGDDDDDEMNHSGSRSVAKVQRTSSRRNKTNADMQDLSEDDGFLENSDMEESGSPKNASKENSVPKRKNGTAKKVTAKDGKKRSKNHDSNGIDTQNGRTGDGEKKGTGAIVTKTKKAKSKANEFEPFRISKIIASRVATMSEWNKGCQEVNTSVLHSGSRWKQDSYYKDVDGKVEQERFLVKWTDASYLHVSWEIEDDLVELIDGAKSALTIYNRKKDEDGLVFSPDERCDGDYFDPGWTQVDRILEIHHPEGVDEFGGTEDEATPADFGVVLDADDEGYEEGLGRQFLIKWENQPYSECTYEYERDFISTGTLFKEKIKEFQERNTPVSFVTLLLGKPFTTKKSSTNGILSTLSGDEIYAQKEQKSRGSKAASAVQGCLWRKK